MKMPSKGMQFKHQDFLVSRKRYKFGIVDDESDTSGSSLESWGSNEESVPLYYHATTLATPIEIVKRTLFSLIPPLRPSKVLTEPCLDPVGPTLVTTLLIALLIYASSKTAPFEYQAFEAIVIILVYMLFTSSFVFMLGYITTYGKYPISYLQVLMLLGYSLIGHLVSLSISFMLYTYPDVPVKLAPIDDSNWGLGDTSSRKPPTSYVTDGGDNLMELDRGTAEGGDTYTNGYKPNERGDTAFLICLPFVAGAATLRVVLIVLSPIRAPPGRMVLGFLLGLLHLLLFIVLHVGFVHPTYQYGSKGK